MELDHIKKLIEAVSASQLTEFKYEEDGVKIELGKKIKAVRETAGAVKVPGMQMSCIQANGASDGGFMMTGGQTAEFFAAGAGASAEEKEGSYLESPLVGRFYAAPEEDAEPFVSVGDTVKKGQTLAIVEAMKLMNEIESKTDGVIAEILVRNGDAVEYGQPLFRIV